MFEKFKRIESEEGGALVVVIGLALACFLSVSAVVTLTLADSRSIALSRDDTLALSSADSGLDAALASVLRGECDEADKSDNFGYSYEVFRSDWDLQKPTDADSYGVTAGCPEDGDLFLVIESTGNAAGREKNVTTVYEWAAPFDSEATERSVPQLLSRSES